MKFIFSIALFLSTSILCFSQRLIEPVSPPPVEQEVEDQEKVFTIVEQMPEFEGGSEALLSFISKNMVYPPNASENQIQGTIYLSYVVRSDGSLSDIKVLKSVPGGSDLNAEAIRVLKLTKGKWKPGKQNGKPVSVNFSLPIKFSLR
jgi:protein TonB